MTPCPDLALDDDPDTTGPDLLNDPLASENISLHKSPKKGGEDIEMSSHTEHMRKMEAQCAMSGEKLSGNKSYNKDGLYHWFLVFVNTDTNFSLIFNNCNPHLHLISVNLIKH